MKQLTTTIEKDSLKQAGFCDLCTRRYIEGFKVKVAEIWILKTCRQCGQATYEESE